MTGDSRMPNFWWCPTHHLYRGGDKRPCADAMQLVPAPPTIEDPRIREIRAAIDAYRAPGPHDTVATLNRIRAILDSAPPSPRVFLPNDQVPVGTVLMAKDGSPFRVPDVHTSEGMARVGVPFVEVLVPSPEEWQAAVDRAKAARGDVEGQHTEGTNP